MITSRHKNFNYYVGTRLEVVLSVITSIHDIENAAKVFGLEVVLSVITSRLGYVLEDTTECLEVVLSVITSRLNLIKELRKSKFGSSAICDYFNICTMFKSSIRRLEMLLLSKLISN